MANCWYAVRYLVHWLQKTAGALFCAQKRVYVKNIEVTRTPSEITCEIVTIRGEYRGWLAAGGIPTSLAVECLPFIFFWHALALCYSLFLSFFVFGVSDARRSFVQTTHRIGNPRRL